MQVTVMDRDAIPHVISIPSIMSTAYLLRPTSVVVTFAPDGNGRSTITNIPCDDIDHIRFVMKKLASASDEWREVVRGRLGLN